MQNRAKTTENRSAETGQDVGGPWLRCRSGLLWIPLKWRGFAIARITCTVKPMKYPG
jgi:hypothetical protein